MDRGSTANGHDAAQQDAEALAADVGRMIAAREEPHELVLRRVAQRIARHFSGWTFLFFFSHGSGRLDAVVSAGRDGPIARLRDEPAGVPAGDDGSRVLPLIRRGESVVIAVERPDELSSWLGTRTRVIASNARVTSLAAVPLAAHGRIFGGICLTRHLPAPALTKRDLDALEALSARIAGALETERLVHELHGELDAQAGVREALQEARERFQAAFAHAPVGLALFSVAPDQLGRIMESNLHMAEIFRARPDDLLDADPSALSHPDDVDVGTGGMQRLFAGEIDRHEVEKRFVRFDGEVIEARLVVTVVRRADGTARYGICLFEDVTERRRTEQALAQRAAQQEAIAALGRKALAGTDLRTLMQDATDAIHAGIEADDVLIVELLPDGGVLPLGRSPAKAPGDAELAESVVTALAEHFPRETSRSLESGSAVLRALSPTSAAGLVLWLGSEYGGRSFRLVIGFRDQSHVLLAPEAAFVEAAMNVVAATRKRLRVEASLRKRATHDRLTGLPNRALFEECLRHALTRGARERSMLAVARIDLGLYQQVNDTAGRKAGDELLVTVAGRLQQGLEPTDTLAHLEGDEFTLLCENVDGEREAIATAQRLLDRLASPVVAGGLSLSLRASVGVVLDDSGRATAEGLIRDADMALHRAKDRGVRLEIFDEQMRHRVLERAQLEQDLRRALAPRQLTLHFQPMVSLTDRRIVALEALLRWEHPVLGLVPPSAFMPVAESSGLIVEIGRWALTEVCRQIGRWEPMRGSLYVSIDVFARELADPGYPDQLRAILRHAGVAADRLALELAPATHADAEIAPAVLQRIGEVGVRLLLDDFGTGAVPISVLRHLPVAALKLDAALVGGIGAGDRDRKIVAAVAAMGAALDMDVIAQGVETSELATIVIEAGCVVVQGTRIFGPAPAGAIDPLLDDPVRALPHLWPLVDATLAAAHDSRPDPLAGAGHLPAHVSDRATARSFLGLSDAARALDISPSTLRRWADGGRIQVDRTAGGHRRFSAAEVARVSGEADPPVPAVMVRSAEFPTGPVPGLHAILQAGEDRLAVAAGRAVYQGDSTGWFQAEEGNAAVGRWLETIARAARTGDYALATEGSQTLVTAARAAGASLLERHLLVERLADLAVRSMQQRNADREELLNARRLFLRLRQLVLAETPEPAG